MRKYRSAEEQVKLINQCRTSGMSDRHWCSMNDIPISTFYTWITRLHRKGYTFPDAVKADDYIPETNEVVKVDIVPEPDATAMSDYNAYQNAPMYNSSVPLEVPAIEINIGKLNIRLSNDVNPLLFEKTLKALGGGLW